MKSNTENWGGARAGAGRKAVNAYDTKIKRIPAPLESTVEDIIRQFKASQIITKSQNIPLDAMVLPQVPKVLRVPFSEEKIPAGFPSPAEPYATDYLDFNELLVRNPAATITVRCGGFSMLDAGIEKEDLLVIDRSVTPKHRDIVMADLGNEYTIKRLHILHDGTVELRSENTTDKYPDFHFKEGEQLSIVGVVVFVLKDMRK